MIFLKKKKNKLVSISDMRNQLEDDVCRKPKTFKYKIEELNKIKSLNFLSVFLKYIGDDKNG